MSVALALLLLASPEPLLDGGTRALALPSLPFVWELPPKTMHEAPIDGTTWVAGVPVRLRYVMVHDTAAELGRHFLTSFERQGLYVAPDQAFDRVVTAVDPQSIVTYTVVLQPNAPGYTTVILGEAMPLETKTELSSVGLPVPPGVKNAVPVSFEGQTVLAFNVREPSAGVRAFYARELPLRGYRPGEADVWLRPGEQLEVTLEPDGAQTRVLLKLQRKPEQSR